MPAGIDSASADEVRFASCSVYIGEIITSVHYVLLCYSADAYRFAQDFVYSRLQLDEIARLLPALQVLFFPKAFVPSFVCR